MPQIRVVGVSVDKNLATLFTDTGETIQVNQGDTRLHDLINEIMPIIARKEIAVVDLDAYSVFGEFTKKTNGFMRFFKVAKSAVTKFLGVSSEPDISDAPRVIAAKVEVKTEIVANPELPTTMVETKVSTDPAPTMYAPQTSAPVTQEKKAENLMQAAAPLGSTDVINSNETIIGVTQDGTVIPGMEQLRGQFQHAKIKGSTAGMEKFLARIAAIIKDRQHSVEDLLRFMEKGDMPVTENGDIVAYKVLKSKRNKANGIIPGIYVDCHTKNVTQRVGSYVNVDESLVDKNRRNECSNGLHIARRSYISGFSGDVCMMCVIAPEDVITVPHNDPNKVRVCGYHIVAELPKEAHQLLQQNKPITELPAMKELLAEVLKGNHIPRIESVKIGGGYGSNVVITKLGSAKDFEAVVTATVEEVEKAEALAENIQHGDGKRVDPKAINQAVAKIEQELAVPAAEVPVTRVDTVGDTLEMSKDVAEWYRAGNYEAIRAKKLRIKKSYTSMGFGPLALTKLLEELQKIDSATKPAEEVTKQEEPKTEPVKDTGALKDQKADEFFAKPTSYKQQIRKLYDNWIVTHSVLSLETMRAIKKASKKSWADLGLTRNEEAQIVKALNGDDAPVASEVIEEKPKALPSVNRLGWKKTLTGYDPIPATPATSASAKEWARYWFTVQNWDELKDLKKARKVSWFKLGFTSEEVDEIQKH